MEYAQYLGKEEVGLDVTLGIEDDGIVDEGMWVEGLWVLGMELVGRCDVGAEE